MNTWASNVLERDKLAEHRPRDANATFKTREWHRRGMSRLATHARAARDRT